MAPGPFKLMAKNWKKTLFFLTTGNGALILTYDYTMTRDVMMSNCRKAVALGDKKIKNFNDQPRHITVILNPIAGKRKSKKLYTKWVEPLLHLAGIKVSLIETESPNQAYDLMKIMSNCDGVAIVGGDGTIHEALNGLLHRPDCSRAARDFPIGIMPTGQYNSIARYIHQNISYRNQKEFLIHSTMRLIESTVEKHDVLKISHVDNESNETQLPIYALRDVRYGIYQDNFVKLSGYKIYQTYIKPLWLRLQRTFSSKFPKPQIDSISYTEPCVGCSRCYEQHRLVDTLVLPAEEKSANGRWWGILAPISKSSSGLDLEEQKELELSKRDNPDCNKWINFGSTSDITDFRACMMGDKKVRLSVSSHGEYTPSEIVETQEIRLDVKKKPLEQADDDSDKTDKFLIDGQPSQARSIRISTLNKPITIFTGVTKFVV